MAALGRRFRGHSWSDTEYLLAELGDAINRNTEMTRVVGSEDGKFTEPPKFMRPGDEKKLAKEKKQLRRNKKALAEDLKKLLPGG